MSVAIPRPAAGLGTVVILLLLWVVATAFNVTKAVHIDDTAYLEIALAIRDDPLHAMSAPISWVREREPIHSVNQPHLFFYFLAASAALFGESEIAFHLVESFFTLLALGFFYLLAQRFAPNRALFLAALFVLGPAVLPGQNVMCDVPMLACWLMFLWAILKPDRSLGDLVFAAVAASAACLIKYTSLVLLPVLALDLLWQREWRRLWVLGIPVAALGAWSLFNYLDYGGVHLLGRPRGVLNFEVVGRRLLTALISLGAITPFSVLLLPRLLSRRGGRWLLVAAALAGGLLVGWAMRTWGDAPGTAMLRGAFLANGIVLLVWGLFAAAGRQDVVLAALILGLLAFLVLLAPFMAVRHVMPLVPILLLLLGRHGVLESGSFWRGSALTLTLVLGIVLAVSDWAQADIYRQAAPRWMAEAIARRDAESPEATIWYTGHWGWQWYARKAGMRQYDLSDSPLREGDYLVSSEHQVPRQEIAPADQRRLQRISGEVVPAGPATALRLTTRLPLGGYYAIGLKAMPWVPSNAPLEEFALYRVGPPEEK